MAFKLTFTFEQELRSEFMNSILKGIVKPGVYNGDMYIATKTEAGFEGIYLVVKEGTSIILSNGRHLDGQIHYRDLDDLGEYLIKATAISDTEIELASTQTATGLFTVDSGTFEPNAPLLFVAAHYLYDSDTGGNVDISFDLYRPDYENLAIADIPTLPNEGMNVNDGLYKQDESYIILGTLINSKLTIPGGDYVSGGGWDPPDVDGFSGNERWLRDYVFTARGFEDYANSIIRDYKEDMPELMFSRNIKNIFFSEGEIVYNGCSYRVDGKTWRNLYGYNDTPFVNTAPNPLQGFIIDYNYSSDLQAAWSSNLPTINPNKTYLTVVFMGLSGKDAYSSEQNLSTILNVETKDATYSLLPITVELDPLAFETDPVKTGSILGTTANILPLDLSVSNINRLEELLFNRTIFHKLADYLRRNEDLPPYLNPTNGESLIPIFVGLRSTDENGDFKDEVSNSSGGIHPVNCLTMKELQSSPHSNIINVIENVFDVISILD